MPPKEPECSRCGQCCLTAVIVLESVLWDEDEKELGKWLKFHRCDLEKVGDNLGIRIPLTCEYLRFARESGLAECRNYDDRPVICREYLCKRAGG